MKHCFFAILLFAAQVAFADIVIPGEFRVPTTVYTLGLKMGYEIGRGFFLAPEAGVASLRGDGSKTYPFVGATLGYKRLFSRKGNESSVYGC